MRNIKLVSKIIGYLLYFEALLMLACLCVSAYYGDDDVLAFAVAVAVTFCAGLSFCYYGRESQNRLNRRDSYLVVAMTWVVFSLFGTLPYIISGYIPTFSDAFFEAMSNFTTTGLSTFNVPMPHGLIFWRSLAQWIGGLGIVFFTIAILPSFADGDVKIFAAESTGPTRNRLHPRIRTNSKWIWVMYLALTVACALCLSIAGMGVFDAINHSMVTTATGGHTPYGESIAHFNSAAIEYIEIIFMLLAGINFTVLYSVLFKLRFKQLCRNSEVRFYLGAVLVVTVILSFAFLKIPGMSIEHAIRSSLFETVSILTSTGFYSENLADLPQFMWIMLFFCMIVGACAGSTSGGIKSIRVVMLMKNVRNEFRRILHPNAVLPIRVNGEVMTRSIQPTLAAFVTLYIIIIIVSSLAFVALGISLDHAYEVTISCISNCGPAFGPQLDAQLGWDTLPLAGKWLCSALMLIGRLEIFSVLVIFTKSFWKDV